MTFFPPIFRLYPVDIHTTLHWSLDESAEPFLSTGTNTTLSLTKGFNNSNVHENRTGLFSKAIDFTPDTSLTSGDTNVRPPGDSFTISCWVFCRSFPSPCNFVGKTYHLEGTGWNSPFWSISMSPSVDGYFVTDYAITASENTLTGSMTDPIPLNTWAFLAVTFDGVNIRQYINGNLVGISSDINDLVDWGDDGPWCVGGNNLQQTGGQDGLIDDVRIENIVRTSEYLQAQYKDGVGFYELPTTSTFTPRDVGGLVLWLRSDKGVITTDGYVSKVKDQSGFGSDCTQSSSIDKPLYGKYLGQGGHPFVKFDVDQEWLSGTLTSPSAPLSDLTFFLVSQFIDDNNRVAIAMTDNSFTISSGMRLSIQSSNVFRIERFASGGDQTTNITGSTTEVKIYSGISSNATLQGYVNNTADGTPAGSTTGRDPIYKYVAGAADNTGTNAMDGYIYEYMVYDRVLSSNDRTLINDYLVKKYAISQTVPPPFSPTDLPDLQLWLRADLGVTLNGSTVSNWMDQSGNSNDMAQSNASHQPTFATSGINGLPDIVYSGNQYIYDSTTDLFSTAVTAFCIFSTTQAPIYPGTYTIFGKGYATEQFEFHSGQGGNNDKLVISIDGSSVMSDAVVNDGNPHYAVATWDNSPPGTITLYIDGVAQSSTATNTTTVSGGDSNAVGSEVSSGGLSGGTEFVGNSPEVGLYNRKLSSGELDSLHAYLRDRAGL